MQRYDREREARAYRSGRDSELRGNYRDDEHFQTQPSRQSWRDDDLPGMRNGNPDEWRSVPAGYEDEGYRADSAQPRHGRTRSTARTAGQDYGHGYAHRDPQSGGWRDHDDSGQGYIGAYGSDLGYGRGRNDASGNRRLTSRDDYLPRAIPGMSRDSYDERGFGELASQSHRGRGPKNYVRSDDRIKEDLSERLSDDPYIDAGDITIEVKNAVVTLTGSVDARALKHRAEDIADHCSGVKDVENKLSVRKSGSGQNLAASPGGGATNEATKKH